MKEEDLILEFTCKTKICPTNAMYAIGMVRQGKYSHAMKYRSEKLKIMQDEMAEELPTVIPEDKKKRFVYCFNMGCFDVETYSTFYIPKDQFYKQDVSNLIKSYEDCVAEFLQMDDSFTSKYIAEKVPVIEKHGWVHTIMKLVRRNHLVETAAIDHKNHAEQTRKTKEALKAKGIVHKTEGTLKKERKMRKAQKLNDAIRLQLEEKKNMKRDEKIEYISTLLNCDKSKVIKMISQINKEKKKEKK